MHAGKTKSADYSIFTSLSRKLRDEYDKLEGALKKLGVDPDCVVTEEEDGYNAESDLEDSDVTRDSEKDKEEEVATYVPPTASMYTNSRLPPRGEPRVLDRVDEVLLD